MASVSEFVLQRIQILKKKRGGGGGGTAERGSGRGIELVKFFFHKDSKSKGGGVDGLTDKQQAKPICPFNFYEVGGITMQ